MNTSNPEIPTHIEEAIKRQDSIVAEINDQLNALRFEEIDPGVRNDAMVPLIRRKQSHQRLAEQIRGEFDLPPKHKKAREKLRVK